MLRPSPSSPRHNSRRLLGTRFHGRMFVSPEYKQDAVTRQLQEFIVSRGLAKIKDIDCSEFPCVETLLFISGSQLGQGSDAVSVAAISVMPDDEDTKTRVRHRSDAELH